MTSVINYLMQANTSYIHTHTHTRISKKPVNIAQLLTGVNATNLNTSFCKYIYIYKVHMYIQKPLVPKAKQLCSYQRGIKISDL